MSKRITVNNKFVFDNGSHLYYADGLGVLKEPFAYLMDQSMEGVENYFKIVRNVTFDFQYNEKTTVEEFNQYILRKIGFKRDPRIPNGGWDGADPCHIIIGKKLIHIENSNRYFEDVINRYSLAGTINSILVFWSGAGDIWNDDGLRYYIPSKEGCKHKKPHVHVEYRHDEKASIDIKTGDRLQGKMRQNRLKKAKERILSNREFLLECWNEKTDGFNVDINYYLGITHIEEESQNEN